MSAQTAPRENPSGEPAVDASKPPSRLGGFGIALVFLALLVVLIVANM